MLQKDNRRAAAEKTVRKLEAETRAFVVAQTIGLSKGRAGQAACGTLRSQMRAGPHLPG